MGTWMIKGRIRPYGPGKFYNLIDSYAYEVALDGIDEEVSYPEGGGWYGYLGIDQETLERIQEAAREGGDPLTPDEEELLEGTPAVIFFERSDGIVEAEWYYDIEDAERDWAEIEAEVSGEDDDDAFSDDQMYEGYVIEDARGGGYDVVHEGRTLGNYEDMDEALAAINEHMESEQFWPNVYYVNERGNVDLLDPTTGKSIESRV
jgi:hypothetical protein